jgi:hypothetical protein
MASQATASDLLPPPARSKEELEEAKLKVQKQKNRAQNINTLVKVTGLVVDIGFKCVGM